MITTQVTDESGPSVEPAPKPPAPLGPAETFKNTLMFLGDVAATTPVPWVKTATYILKNIIERFSVSDRSFCIAVNRISHCYYLFVDHESQPRSFSGSDIIYQTIPFHYHPHRRSDGRWRDSWAIQNVRARILAFKAECDFDKGQWNPYLKKSLTRRTGQRLVLSMRKKYARLLQILGRISTGQFKFFRYVF